MSRKALDIDGITAWLNAQGFPHSRRAVELMSCNRKIPTFKGLDGKRYIYEDELASFFQQRQNAAVKEVVS